MLKLPGQIPLVLISLCYSELTYRKEVGPVEGGDDYVQEEEIEFKICWERYEFYKCEMPCEALARIKARQDSLSRMQGVPLGLKPICSIRK